MTKKPTQRRALSRGQSKTAAGGKAKMIGGKNKAKA
jgi:hypothetical protein